MFYYYGRRKQIAHLYPEPRYSTIIEPFAGSAAYSLHNRNFENKVILYDIDEWVTAIWTYLLQATENDILSLPDVEVGQDIRTFKSLTEAELLLIGFHINPASMQRSFKVMQASRWSAGKKYISKMVNKVKHWEFHQKDFRTIENSSATWFIDPPFQVGGECYRKPSLDYLELAQWCKSRCGQVIVCEAEPATWLPFKWLGVAVNNGGLNGAKKRSNLIWTNTQDTR